VAALNVAVSPIPNLSATDVQTALEQIEAQVDDTITDIFSLTDGITAEKVPNNAAVGFKTNIKLNPATATDIGGVFVAPNNGIILSAAGGLGVSPATTTTIGGIKVGDRLVIDPDGTLSVSDTVGSVTSVDASGGSTGLTFSGGPIESSGTLLLDGTLNIESGGTGATTASEALRNLLPSQSGNIGKILTSDGTNATWQTPTTVVVEKIDPITFNGTTTSFSLRVAGNPVTPSTSAGVLIVLGGVVQTSGPADAYTVTGSTITFASPPPAGTSFYGVFLG
jgi:hypothetical protein